MRETAGPTLPQTCPGAENAGRVGQPGQTYSRKWNVYALPVDPEALELEKPGARNA
jgi:hypothetical protein